MQSSTESMFAGVNVDWPLEPASETSTRSVHASVKAAQWSALLRYEQRHLTSARQARKARKLRTRLERPVHVYGGPGGDVYAARNLQEAVDYTTYLTGERDTELTEWLLDTPMAGHKGTLSTMGAEVKSFLRWGGRLPVMIASENC